MIRCSANHLLGDFRAGSSDYVGLFCLYCGDQVADIAVDNGQLRLQARNAPPNKQPRRLYLAAIYRNNQQESQRVIQDVQPGPPNALLFLAGSNQPLTLPTHRLLLAFQDAEEKLELP